MLLEILNFRKFKMKKVLPIIFFSFTLMGCATEYQSSGMTGGYNDQMTGPNTATVEFQGNGFTKSTTTKKFAMRRAAELTLQRGFDYFLIEGGNTSTKEVEMSGTIQCNSYGNTTSCNEIGGGSVSKPSSSLDIRMFRGKTPNQTGYYDARYLSR